MLFLRISKAFSINKTSVRILHTKGNNIHFNLAIEQYLFQKENLKLPTLFLWRNSPTIVIGKHQNPWKQCKVQQMKKKEVHLSRRKTGGGAVYQDLGNTCFSFLTPYQKDQQYDYRSVNNQILIKSLKSLGVNAQVSGRNDITVNNRKISGSAYRLHLGNKHGEGRKALHHGTILFNVDFNALQSFLNPNKKKLQSKGVQSVVSRVLNLKDEYPTISHQKFCQQLQKTFIEYYGEQKPERQTLDLQNLRENQVIKEKYERLKSWQWLYGQCPYFKYTIQDKFEWGLIQITFEVKDGRIQKCRIYSDCLYPDYITQVNEQIIGVKYDSEGIQEFNSILREQFGGNESFVKMSEDLCRWVKTEL